MLLAGLWGRVGRGYEALMERERERENAVVESEDDE